MTLIVAVCLVTGGVLILSAVNDWSLQQTVSHVLKGTAGTATKGGAPTSDTTVDPGTSQAGDQG